VPPVKWNRPLFTADRLSQGWSVAELARRANLSFTRTWRFLAGKFSGEVTAKRLAAALGHPIDRYFPAQLQRELRDADASTPRRGKARARAR
jgi:transcriptional regulator with XRE-family HTH domain